MARARKQRWLCTHRLVGSILEHTSLLKVFAKNICEAQLVKALYISIGKIKHRTRQASAYAQIAGSLFELVRFSYKLTKKDPIV